MHEKIEVLFLFSWKVVSPLPSVPKLFPRPAGACRRQLKEIEFKTFPRKATKLPKVLPSGI